MAGHDYHWIFGAGCHISFPAGGNPVSLPNRTFATNEGSAVASDASGGLRFYTEGKRLYDPTGTIINPSPQPELGGTHSSTHSALVVPPAGGGSLHHIFAVGDWDGSNQPNVGPVTHCTVAAGGSVSIVSPPTDLMFGPLRSTEKLAGVPHEDCERYWLVAFDAPTAAGAQAFLHAILVSSDAPPTASVKSPYAASGGFCTKFSPDGRLLAVANVTTIDILNFDRATGLATLHSQITGFDGNLRAYGVEFSPSGRYLYFTGLFSGSVRRHPIGVQGSSSAYGTTVQVGSWPTVGRDNYRLGALQLGPNGRIYGVKVQQASLLEIGDPDNVSPANVAFNASAVALNARGDLGLPTFLRIADDCRSDRCARLAAEVDAQLAQDIKLNQLRPCRGEQPAQPTCAPAPIPDFAPQVFIRWGDSRCDCIEGDDTEIMHLTVCNPYSNLSLSNVTVQQLIVVDSNGNQVPTLPNGDPAIELVPQGPYCFDDIAPCTCVTREFVLRLRGAPGGRYRILVRGICFDICVHRDTDACFRFDVCPD